MINDIMQNTETRMKKCVETFKTQIKKIHTGRISSNILDNIQIKYQAAGTVATPLRYLANIITENPGTLVVTVFDAKMVTLIEKTIIQKSDLNLNISSHGNIIRVSLPVLTEERRHQLIKLVNTESEKTKISIRNIRRSMNEKIKILIKNKMINQDKEYLLQNKIQKSTDTWTKIINKIVENKSTELMHL
ncbi:ribosome recycling factor [Blochmannia endosymbiont of Polyrhachis (Hedomyrma) turneri]|uniref:ribosome recycling factor n=1 Tax=Blochmannia endosymbiont of Polyrhachis (Hedomyrma) turneri TaxID=1505596 RepID=UPI00061A694E|nr:ribosome recycling factor [Blochmannia endosymbiont of Polyrhachis (Hedomyrma) turneri]AKC59862.1 Ribosome-recycling factor [Blochmannia endosymbiont of Polyrhachis (Hedomyrma) turneri]